MLEILVNSAGTVQGRKGCESMVRGRFGGGLGYNNKLSSDDK